VTLFASRYRDTTLIEVPSGRLGYSDLLLYVKSHGKKRAPRGMATVDLGHTTVVMEPWDALPVGTGRNLNLGIAAVEALQLISGTMNAPLLTRIAPGFRQFQEEDGTFHGAYGPRTWGQLPAVVDKLRRDPDTRQAVATIWDPIKDNESARDIPCTIALGFAIVEDRLDMHVTMRSNDAWLGWPYDVHTFTQLQFTIATSLDVLPGAYRHTAWSLHLYERDLDKILSVGEPSAPARLPTGIGHDGLSWGKIEDIALRLLRGGKISEEYMTDSEVWYRDAIAPHLG
jgi:thymidylate synthase